MNFSVGEKYVGEWADGKQTGQGTLTTPDEEKYGGGFKKGKPNSQGIATSSEGRKGEGEWKEDKPWEVKEYDKNGNIIGKTVNGKELRNNPPLKLKK